MCHRDVIPVSMYHDIYEVSDLSTCHVRPSRRSLKVCIVSPEEDELY